MKQNNGVPTGEKFIIYILLFVLALVAFIGLGEIIAFLLYPALLAYSLVRLGYKHTFLQAVLIVVFYGLMYENFIEVALLTILPGFCFGICVRRQKGIRFTVSAGAIALVLAESIIYMLDSFRADIAENITQALSEQSAEMVGMLGLSATDGALILEMLSYYIPSILVMSIALISYVTFLVLQFFLRRRAPEVAMMYPRFRELRASKGCVFVWIVALIVSFFNKGPIGTTAANLAMILCCYIILCGFSVFTFWVGAIKNRFLRLVIGLVLLWLSSLIAPMAMLFGLMDTIIHFRNWKRGDE